MRVLPLATLLLTLLGACRSQAPADNLDGLYFSDEGPIPRLVVLKQGHFALHEHDRLLRRGTYEARDGLLRLKPEGSGTQAELRTTYAVVEGRLLLGVLRRVGGERHRWTSAVLPTEFLGRDTLLGRPSAYRPGDFRIDWDMREGSWHFTSGARRVVLRGVARFEHPANEGRTFVPVFRPPAQRGGEDDPATMLDDRDSLGRRQWWPFPFGWEAEPQSPLEWDGERVRLRDANGSVPGTLSSNTYTYERRGEAVVTPWTVDLGPVGLVPVRADPSALEGVYVSGAAELFVSPQRRPDVRCGDDPPEYKPRYRVPGEEQWCQYAPDARGVVTWGLGDAHPAMGHLDKAFTVFCFALADGRVVRYITSGGCSGKVPAKLEVFQRDSSP